MYRKEWCKTHPKEVEILSKLPELGVAVSFSVLGHAWSVLKVGCLTDEQLHSKDVRMGRPRVD